MKLFFAVLMTITTAFAQDIIEDVAGNRVIVKFVDISDTHVIFLYEDQSQQTTIPRDKVKRIVLSDRTIIFEKGIIYSSNRPKLSDEKYQALLADTKASVSHSYEKASVSHEKIKVPSSQVQFSVTETRVPSMEESMAQLAKSHQMIATILAIELGIVVGTIVLSLMMIMITLL